MKFKITYPLDSVLISQVFGANQQMYSDQKYGGIKGHNGLDFFAGHGNPVYATHDGLAQFQIDSGGGHGVVIISDKEYEDVNGFSSYFKSIYWHLCDGLKEPQFASPFQGKTGFTPVKMGDLIGYADNTGASTGDHLHFGLKACDKGDNFGEYNNLNQDNGYLGAINPMPYFDGYFPKQVSLMKKEIGLLQQLVELMKKLRK